MVIHRVDNEAEAVGEVPFANPWIREAGSLREKLALIRRRGDAAGDCEHQPGLRFIGTPIRDLSGRTFAAIRVRALAFKFPTSAIEQIASTVMTRCAFQLSVVFAPAQLS